MNAHREVAWFRFGRLYDQQNGALSLPSLVDAICANQHLFEIERFKERLKGNPFVDSLAEWARQPDGAILAEDARSVSERSDPLVKKLLAIRNRVLAHRDPRVVLGTLKDPTGTLDATEIDALLKRAARIVNRYCVMFRAGGYSMGMIGADDFKLVLSHVRSGVAASEAEIVGQIERAQQTGGDAG